MKQIRIIGMADALNGITNYCSPADFSDGLYNGVSLYRRKDKKLVVLLASRNADPVRWKIMDGVSEFHFCSFSEATNFCRLRGYIFVKDQLLNVNRHL